MAETNAAVDLLFAFTGKQLDDATGLQHNLFRWYDSALGQWLSEDPLGFAAGDENLRRYVGNQFTALIDPLGLDDTQFVPPPIQNCYLNLDFFAGASPVHQAPGTWTSWFAGYAGDPGDQALGWIGFAADVLTIPGTVVCEPLDWAVTGIQIAKDPTDPLNYLGLLPLVPGAATNLAKKVDWRIFNWRGNAPRGPLRSDSDVLRETLGPAWVSHPEEYEATMQRLQDAQVDVSFSPGNMGYSPREGGPGRLTIDPDASIGALRHEVRHFDDIALGGYKPLGYYFQNLDEFWRLEYRGYFEEWDIARQLGDEAAVDKILDQMRIRRRELLGE